MTGGNPFLLEELLRALGDAADADDPVAAAHVHEIGPLPVAHAVLGRLTVMWPDALALARAVAILGGDADLRAAALLADLDVPAAQAAADALTNAQVLLPERPLRFVHPILRQAVYTDIPPGRRALQHDRAAGVLEQLGADPDHVAVQLLATEPAGRPAVAKRLHAAAERSLARGAPNAAARQLERALAEPPDPATRTLVLFALGHAERVDGRLAEATAHLREALESTPAGEARDAVCRELATSLATAGTPHDGLRVLEEAIASCPERQRERRLRLEGDLAILRVTHDDLTQRGVREAEEIASGLTGRTPAERVLLGALAYLRYAGAIGTADEAVELAERALGAGRLLHEQTADGFTYFWAVLALLSADRDEAAEEYWNAGIHDARARGSGTALTNAAIAFTRLHLFRGDVVQAEASARLWEQVGPEVRYAYGSYSAVGALVVTLVEGGQVDEAQEVLRGHGLEGSDLPSLATVMTLLHARIVLRTAQARHAEAAADVDELLRRQTVRMHAGLPHGAAIVRALLNAGQPDRALSTAREQLHVAERWGAPSHIGIARRSLGLATGGPEGVALLEQSVEVLEGTPCRLELARTYTALGAALRRGNRRAGAREHLRRALDLAGRCGAGALAAETMVELRACGARPRRAVLSGVASLTPTEHRVADLVARGLSNPEVAQMMFVTRATVESHLVAIYRKLDISSRAELPGALAEKSQEAP